MGITIDIIPSKSVAHRALICSALSERTTDIVCDLHSKDIDATQACVTAIREGGTIMECGESGSTLRFLLPVMGALGRKGIFMTQGRLSERPLSPLYEELEAHGCTLSPKGESPITIEGQLRSGIYTIPGNISSQYISGLMLALPLLEGDSVINIIGELQSSGYVQITQDVLQQFGITWLTKITNDGMRIEIPGNQKFQGPENFVVEGDWSGAGFWFAAGVLGRAEITIRGLNPISMQGDRQILDIVREFGGRVEMEEAGITVYPSKLTGIDVDISAIPDLAPVIALLGIGAEGTTRILNAQRLRIKESDRIESIVTSLASLGANIREENDDIIIEGNGVKSIEGGACSGYGDHRIVMMEAIASMIARNPVAIDGKENVAKSYPGFFDVMHEAGLDQNLE